MGVFMSNREEKKKKATERQRPHIRLPAGEAALDTSATQEPTGTNEPEQGHGRGGPQEGLEETSGTSGGSVLEENCQ